MDVGRNRERIIECNIIDPEHKQTTITGFHKGYVVESLPLCCRRWPCQSQCTDDMQQSDRALRGCIMSTIESGAVSQFGGCSWSGLLTQWA
jgi:hypothetical protein